MAMITEQQGLGKQARDRNLGLLSPYLIPQPDREEHIEECIKLMLSKTLSPSRQILKGLIDNKMPVWDKVYVTKSDLHYWLIDARDGSRGKVIGFDRKRYEMTSWYGAVYLLDLKTMVTVQILYKGFIIVDGVKFLDGGRTNKGFHKNPALSIRYFDESKLSNVSSKLIKKQFIIKGMTEGYITMLCMGTETERVMDMHHMRKNMHRQNDEDSNIIPLFKEEHRILPLYIR
jgi:hypothetical protein